MQAFSIRDALRFGWEATKRELPTWSKLLLISVIFWALEYATRQGPTGSVDMAARIASVILQLIGVGIAILWINAALLVQGEDPIAAADLLPSPRLYLTYLLGFLLYVISVTVGLFLLILPGVYWAIEYCCFGFLIVDKQLSPLDAFKRSAQLTQGVRGQLFRFALTLVGLNILGALAAGVGLFATLPTSLAAIGYVYRRLLQRNENRS